MGNLIFKIFENLISAGPCMKIRDSLKNKAFAPISAIPTVKKEAMSALKLYLFRHFSYLNSTPSGPSIPTRELNPCTQQYWSELLALNFDDLLVFLNGLVCCFLKGVTAGSKALILICWVAPHKFLMHVRKSQVETYSTITIIN